MKLNPFLLLALGVILLVSACTKEAANTSDKRNTERPGGTETASISLVDVIKKQKLANYQSTTIGNAFDSYRYLTKKEWKAESLKSRHFTVDFSGWFEHPTLNEEDLKDGITARGLEVKFVVEPDGSFYVLMVSKIESRSDGKMYRYQLQDGTGILASIYANRKIEL